jgi:hypothetical protein
MCAITSALTSHDAASLGQLNAQPLRVLWGSRNPVLVRFNKLEVWTWSAAQVIGKPIDPGHSLAEEALRQVSEELQVFFAPEA